MRRWWRLTRPGLDDLRVILDEVSEKNPIGADNLQDAFEAHLIWLADSVGYKPQVYMRRRGYEIHRASFSRSRRYWRYEFYFLLRQEDVVVIACDYAAGHPARLAAHVAGQLDASEGEL